MKLLSVCSTMLIIRRFQYICNVKRCPNVLFLIINKRNVQLFVNTYSKNINQRTPRVLRIKTAALVIQYTFTLVLKFASIVGTGRPSWWTLPRATTTGGCSSSPLQCSTTS